jgi:hypothetical protein
MVVATLLHPSRETATTIIASEPRLVAAHASPPTRSARAPPPPPHSPGSRCTASPPRPGTRTSPSPSTATSTTRSARDDLQPRPRPVACESVRLRGTAETHTRVALLTQGRWANGFALVAPSDRDDDLAADVSGFEPADRIRHCASEYDCSTHGATCPAAASSARRSRPEQCSLFSTDTRRCATNGESTATLSWRPMAGLYLLSLSPPTMTSVPFGVRALRRLTQTSFRRRRGPRRICARRRRSSPGCSR